jgi:tripartite-type tricarboxylate transporter receptor subunit TctC
VKAPVTLLWRVLAWFLVMTAGLPVQAEQYPSKPVKVILQSAAGAGPDVLGRIVADRLGQRWRQQVLVINRVGAGGLLAAQAAVSAEPDGYTLYHATTGGLVVLPATQKLPFDLGLDLVPIGLICDQPFFIAVAPLLGVSTLPELIALAKKRPDEISYVAGSRGGMPHLTGELLRTKAGIDLTFIPYPNVPQSLQDVMAGRIPVIVETLSGLSSALEGGLVKLLAVTSTKRLANFPDVPTVAESIPEFAVSAWFSLMAPAKTPDNIVQQVNRDLRAVLDQAEVQQKFARFGAYVRPMSPVATAEFIHKEQQLWWPVVRQLNLTAQ